MAIAEFKKELTFAQYAQEKGITPNAVRLAISRGKIPSGYEIVEKGYRTKILRFVGEDTIQTTLPEKQITSRDIDNKQKRIEFARKEVLTLWESYRLSFKKDISLKNEKQKMHMATVNFLIDFNERNMWVDLKLVLGNLTEKTLYNWRSENDLSPKYHYAEEGTNISNVELDTLVHYYLSPNQLNFAQVIRMAIGDFRKMANKDFQIKSERTYLRALKAYKKRNADRCIYLREGKKANNDQNVPYLMRDNSAINVGDAIVIDGHTLNYEIINPITGKPQRMTLIACIDFKSGVPLGWEIMPTENIWALTSAIRRCIINLGFKPRALYLDNGRANRALNKTAIVKDMYVIRGVIEKLGIEVVYAKPYNAQAKIVERFFGDLLDYEKMMPTYSGNNIVNKPARMKRNEIIHREAYRSDNNNLTVSSALQSFVEWVGVYINRVQKSGNNKGYSRAEVYEKSIADVRVKEDFNSRIISIDKLDELMMQDQVRVLYRNGIKFRGRFYWSDRFYNLEKGKDKHKFLIKYDVTMPEFVKVYDEKGYFCDAIEPGKVHPLAGLLGTESDKAFLREALEHQSSLKKQTEGYVKDYFYNKNINNSNSEIEASTSIKLIEASTSIKLIEAKAEQKKKHSKKTNEDPNYSELTGRVMLDWSQVNFG